MDVEKTDPEESDADHGYAGIPCHIRIESQ